MNSFFQLIFFSILFFSFSASAQILATISYKSQEGPVKISITLEEFQDTYNKVRQLAPNAPSAKAFWKDYLRYRIGVEQAYNDPKLVQSPKIRTMFSNPMLKESFEQSLYKMLMNNQLKGQISKVDRMTRDVSSANLRKIYRKNPEFDMNFILISIPEGANANQIKKAQKRADRIYSDVLKSQKNFTQLVKNYSDDQINGQLQINRSRNMIYPTVYNRLKRMKKGGISPPIRMITGFQIVKLNRRIPFEEANRVQLKVAYFDQKRTQVIDKYFNQIRNNYTIKTQSALLNKIR